MLSDFSAEASLSDSRRAAGATSREAQHRRPPSPITYMGDHVWSLDDLGQEESEGAFASPKRPSLSADGVLSIGDFGEPRALFCVIYIGLAPLQRDSLRPSTASPFGGTRSRVRQR